MLASTNDLRKSNIVRIWSSRRSTRIPRLGLLLLILQLSSARLVRGFDDSASTTLRVVHRAIAAEEEGLREECTPKEKCEMCTFSDQKSTPACKETGRRQKFECIRDEADDEEQTQETEFRSCKYTEADEEFALIRLQMFCLLVGSMAFMSIRKQKRVTVSLFDARKNAAKEKEKQDRRDSDHVTEEEEIEFSRMDQENVPLMASSSNPLEVI